MTNAPDMERLEELARAATPGPWDWDGDTLFGRKGVKIIDHASYEGMWFSTYDAGFDATNKALIAAANPETILTLLSDLTNTRAALKEAEGGWQDIETAPKDGTIVHVWADGYEWPETVYWQDYTEDLVAETGSTGFWTYAETLMADATDDCGQEDWSHWRPLPTPPARSKEPK